MNAETAALPRTRLMKLAEVRERTSLGQTTIYRWMNEGRFPQPIRVTGRVVRWREGDIEAWIEQHASATH